jgi:hypothetical protein
MQHKTDLLQGKNPALPGAAPNKTVIALEITAIRQEKMKTRKLHGFLPQESQANCQFSVKRAELQPDLGSLSYPEGTPSF